MAYVNLKEVKKTTPKNPPPQHGGSDTSSLASLHIQQAMFKMILFTL